MDLKALYPESECTRPQKENIKMKNGKLQVGIIGCGGDAHQKHLPALAKSADLCEISAFCDVDKSRAEAAARQYGAVDARVYSDYMELLADDRIDVVHILTPNKMHARMTLEAFAAGKHVMCEKPMAHTTEDARLMVDAARLSGKKFTVSFQNRFREEMQTLHKLCRSGDLGEVYFAKAHAVRRRAVPTWGVFTSRELQGGGPLIDVGSHALDLTLWLMDNYKPKTVMGSVFYKMADQTGGNLFGPWNPERYDVEDSAFGFIKMENGATIFLEAAWVLNVAEAREVSTTLCGTRGGAEVRGGGLYGGTPELIVNTERHGKLFNARMLPGNGGKPYADGMDPGAQEARYWLKAILEDAEPLVTPEQALAVTQILEAIYTSQETGRPVEFS